MPRRLSLATRSGLHLKAQVTAPGATWLDRQLVAHDLLPTATGFGTEIREAIQLRAQYLLEEGLARRDGDRTLIARGLIETLRRRKLDSETTRPAAG